MKTYVSSFILAAIMLGSGVASASHKNWVLKDNGPECKFAVPTAADLYYGGGDLYNPASASRAAYCPVALAARWGNAGGEFPTFSPPLWTDTMSAIVYGGNTGFSCQAQMQAANGSIYFSGTKTGSGTSTKVVVATQQATNPYYSRWAASGGGSDLEANEGMTAKGLVFFCTVPAGGFISGYKVRICQNEADCRFAVPEPEEGGGAGNGDTGVFNWMQTSGMECVPQGTNDRAAVSYNDDGIRNTSTTQSKWVSCPLTTPSSDTIDGTRQIRYTRVYYSGGSTASNCVQAGTCPTCYLYWDDRVNTDWSWNVNMTDAPFQMDPTFGLFQGLAGQSIGQEVNIYLSCLLPPQVTLRGVSARASVSPIQSGT